ncbi:MAG: hypothetical protein LBC96_06750 [Lachnospiraceae bacterium]|jgi:hypothetical protein|nr:hypothetical protein [Lachnospiraceae bacterium]
MKDTLSTQNQKHNIKGKDAEGIVDVVETAAIIGLAAANRGDTTAANSADAAVVVGDNAAEALDAIADGSGAVIDGLAEVGEVAESATGILGIIGEILSIFDA